MPEVSKQLVDLHALKPLNMRNYTCIVGILAKPVSCDLFAGHQ